MAKRRRTGCPGLCGRRDSRQFHPRKDKWDHDAVYNPYAIFDGEQWLLYYNGRKGGVEQIGLALHEREDLGF
jgi:hypothetical protein